MPIAEYLILTIAITLKKIGKIERLRTNKISIRMAKRAFLSTFAAWTVNTSLEYALHEKLKFQYMFFAYIFTYVWVCEYFFTFYFFCRKIFRRCLHELFQVHIHKYVWHVWDTEIINLWIIKKIHGETKSINIPMDPKLEYWLFFKLYNNFD